MLCNCQTAADCQLKKTGRLFEICRGTAEGLTQEQCAAYRAHWTKTGELPPPKVIAERKVSGPGTQLKQLLSELGITNFAGCGCEDKVSQMNRWGVEGCRENFATIRGWIVEAQEKANWMTTIAAAVRAAATGIALQIDTADVAGSLVRIAIERGSLGHSPRDRFEV